MTPKAEYLGLMSLLDLAGSMMIDRRDEIVEGLETVTRVHTLGGVGLPPVSVDKYREALQDGRLDYQQGLLSAAGTFADRVAELREKVLHEPTDH